MKKPFLALVASLFVAGPALAQTDFVTIDADGSGGASYEEVVVAAPDLTEEDFIAADTDQDGALNEEEFTVLIESRG